MFCTLIWIQVALIEPGFFQTELLEHGSKNGAEDIAKGTISKETIDAYGDFNSKMGKTSEPIRMIEKLNGGSAGLEYVATNVVDAVTNIFPLARYVLGYDAQLIRFLLVYIPTFFIDWMQTFQR